MCVYVCVCVLWRLFYNDTHYCYHYYHYYYYYYRPGILTAVGFNYDDDIGVLKFNSSDSGSGGSGTTSGSGGKEESILKRISLYGIDVNLNSPDKISSLSSSIKKWV